METDLGGKGSLAGVGWIARHGGDYRGRISPVALVMGKGPPDSLWVRHGYLAVDFFFCLSGYVIGYAYDDRYGHLSVAAFLRARLIRLHPMAAAGVLLGLACYCLDPFSGNDPNHPWMEPQSAPFWKIAANVVGDLTMLPTRP